MWDLATIVKLNELAAEATEQKLPQRIALETLIGNGSHPKHMVMTNISPSETSSEVRA